MTFMGTLTSLFTFWYKFLIVTKGLAFIQIFFPNIFLRERLPTDLPSFKLQVSSLIRFSFILLLLLRLHIQLFLLLVLGIWFGMHVCENVRVIWIDRILTELLEKFATKSLHPLVMLIWSLPPQVFHSDGSNMIFDRQRVFELQP